MDLSYNEIGDKGAFALSVNPSLNGLDVSYNEINKAGIEALKNNPNLTQLYTGALYTAPANVPSV